MPNLTSNASIYRRGGFTFTGYISTPPLTVVLAGTVTAVPTYPALAIAYILTSGDEDDALPDLEVNFYSSTGVKKANLRVATGAVTTTTSLKVSEFAQGVYDAQIGDTFQVVKYWTIKDRLVSATAALNKDSRITYTDQGSNPPPVCNSGGLYAGFGAMVGFPGGSTSFVIDPDSGGSINHSWDMIDGTPPSSSIANPTGIVFPVGTRYVKHTSTDASNSKSTIEYVLVQVHDRTAYPPLAVQMDTLSSTVEQGWRCTFKLPVGTEGSIDTLPDGALIVYWEDESYNGTQASYGSQMSGRSHIKFVGYLVSDSIHIDPQSNEVTFEAVSPLAILEQTPALPQLMVNKASPAKWSEVKSLTTKKMFWYLAYWHSSLMDTFDFVWNDGVDLSYQRISVEGDTLAAQLRDIANSLGVQVTCDRLGRILFTRDPAFLPLTERSNRTKTYDLTTADIMEVNITRNHRGSVKSVRGEGITPAGKSFFANGPGNAPAPFGTASDTLAKQIMSSLASLIERTELFFAKVNSLFKGQFVPKGGRITLPDGYDFWEPAYREFSTMTLPATLNGRKVGWDNTTRWTVEAANITYDIETGAKSIDITIDHETYGVGATQYTPPPEVSNGVTAYPPLEVQYPSIPVDPFIDVNGNPVIVPGTTSGSQCEVWSGDASWLAENVLTLPTPPFGDNSPGTGLTCFQWVNLGSPGIYGLGNDGLNSTFHYNPDFPDTIGGYTPTILSDVFTLIRAASTLGGVFVYGDGTDSATLDFDFTVDDGGWTVLTVGAPVGVYSPGVGWIQSTAPGDVDPLNTYTGVAIQFALPGVTVTSYNLTYTIVDGIIDATLGNFIGLNLTPVDTNSQPSTGNGTFTMSYTGSTASVTDADTQIFCGFHNNNPASPGGTVVITEAHITFTSAAQVNVRYSSTYGASFGSPLTVGDSPGAFGGFDTQKVGTCSLAGADGEVHIATTLGGSYSLYATMPAGAQPSCIVIPRLKSNGTSNSGSSPDFFVASSVLTAGNEAVWYCHSGGTVFDDITPFVGGEYAVAVSAKCLDAAWSGINIAGVFSFDGTTKLVVSKDRSSWLSRGTVVDAVSISFRRSDKTGQQLYIASSAGALIVSQNLGAALASRLSPDGAALIGAEPF